MTGDTEVGLRSPTSQNKPVAQFGSSEGVLSAAWFHHSSPRLISGMGMKWIRIFDLRSKFRTCDVLHEESVKLTCPMSVESTTPSTIIPTKAILGIATDPFFSYRFASFAEDSTVRIWDARNTSEPALLLNTEYRNGTSQLEWSPLRPGLLATVGRDSPILKIWDIQEGTTREYISSTLHRTTPSQTTQSNLSTSSPAPGLFGTSPGHAFAAGDGQGRAFVSTSSTLLTPDSAALSPASAEKTGGKGEEDEKSGLPVLWKTRQGEKMCDALVSTYNSLLFNSETSLAHKRVCLDADRPTRGLLSQYHYCPPTRPRICNIQPSRDLQDEVLPGWRYRSDRRQSRHDGPLSRGRLTIFYNN